MLTETPDGLYCEAGGFHIDPWGAVPRALITHAHGDHARAGSAAYLCADACAPLLRATLRRRCRDRIAALRPRPHPRRDARQLPPGRPRPRLGADPRRRAGRRVGRLRRLQARGRSHLHAVRRRALRRLHHREHVRAADLSLGSGGRRHRRPRRLVERQRRARARPRSSSATRSARRSGCSRRSAASPTARSGCTARCCR